MTKNVKLGKAATLTGTVKNSQGKAVAGLVVSGRTSTTTSATGRFTARGFAAGLATVSLSDPYVGGYRDKAVKATAKAGKTVTLPTITVS